MQRNAQLEQAIAANPSEDAPWLVYADWFEEQGESRRALALRVLAGAKDGTGQGLEAARLALRVASWLEPEGEAFDFDADTPKAPSPEQVRAAREKGEATKWLPMFLLVWGATSPFEPQATLIEALEAEPTISPELALPAGCMTEPVSFEHVVVSQNGTTGVHGALLLGEVDVCTAFDVLAAHLAETPLTTLQGEERSNAFEDAIDWRPGSRFEALQSLFSSQAGNEGHGLMRGGVEVTVLDLLDTLGPVVASASTQSDFPYALTQFERGWLLFYITF